VVQLRPSIQKVHDRNHQDTVTTVQNVSFILIIVYIYSMAVKES